jgi:ParB family chromosome partitioning protein
VSGQVQNEQAVDDEDDAIRPLPDRLVCELTAERTLALRDALANAPDAAFIALLHALCLSVFRSLGQSGCVQIGVTQSWLGNATPSLRESVWSTKIQHGTNIGRHACPTNRQGCGRHSWHWLTRSR